MMRIRVQIIIESDQETAPPHVEEVACFERGALTPETLGLRLDEAKQMLAPTGCATCMTFCMDYPHHDRLVHATSYSSKRVAL